jgi:DNA-binding MarR family transcriptional regulator
VDEQTRQAAIRLQSLATRLLRLARSANDKHGIGSAQYSAMAVLYARGPMALVDLARAERVTHPTMSRVVAALAKIGAIERTEDPSDRRSRTVALTGHGRALYEKICSNRVAVTAAILSQLKPDTVEEVIQAVERVAGPLEQHLTGD